MVRKKAAFGAFIFWLLGALFLCACENQASGEENETEIQLVYINYAEAPLEMARLWERTDIEDLEEPGEDARRINLDEKEAPLILTEGGEYVLSGTLNGQILLEADEDTQFHLFLSDVQVKASHGPALWGKGIGKLVLTALQGSENLLEDSETRWGEEPSAAVYAPAELTVNGTGSLRVAAHYRDGLRTKGLMKVLDAGLEVSAERDGLRGNEGVYLENCAVMVASGQNGLLSETGRDMAFKNVSLDITAGTYGIWPGGMVYAEELDASINAAAGVSPR